MYLALLSGEQKELFLGLAFDIASADGDYSDEEKAVIAGYCQEMHMSFIQEKMVKPVDEIIARLDSICDAKEKKIIVFETIGLAMADNNYNDSERKMINDMVETFKLESDFAERCELILNEYITFQGGINQLVIG